MPLHASTYFFHSFCAVYAKTQNKLTAVNQGQCTSWVMSASTDASWGFWTDHSRGYFDREQIRATDGDTLADLIETGGWQILATDYWSQCMIALVAVCLTLAGPYVFKIARSFLGWLIRQLGRLQIEWNSGNPPHSSASLQNSPENQTLLVRGDAGEYGTLSPSDSSGRLAKPDGSSVRHTRTQDAGEQNDPSLLLPSERSNSSTNPPRVS